jgi:hypothetical protein
MAGKIFYRERIKGQKGARKFLKNICAPGSDPGLCVAVDNASLDRKPLIDFGMQAVCDANLKVYGDHFRKKELEQLAAAANCDLVELQKDHKSASKH